MLGRTLLGLILWRVHAALVRLLARHFNIGVVVGFLSLTLLATSHLTSSHHSHERILTPFVSRSPQSGVWHDGDAPDVDDGGALAQRARARRGGAAVQGGVRKGAFRILSPYLSSFTFNRHTSV